MNVSFAQLTEATPWYLRLIGRSTQRYWIVKIITANDRILIEGEWRYLP